MRESHSPIALVWTRSSMFGIEPRKICRIGWGRRQKPSPVFLATLLSRWTTLKQRGNNSAPAKKLKVNLTLPLEVDQTTTMYSWREPSTIAILFCCQAWIGADYEKRAPFFFSFARSSCHGNASSWPQNAPFRCSYDDFFKCNAQGTCLGPLACLRKREYCYIGLDLVAFAYWL